MEKKRKFEPTNSIPNSLFPNANLPDINRQIADFLHHSLTRANDKIKSLRELPELSSHQIEIEAKLGHLVNKQSETRIRLPVMSETILNDSEIEFKFISNMTMRQHSSYNQLLNHFAGKIKLKYVHTKATDQFLHSPSLRNVRRTIDEETTVTIVKTKIEHLNIYIPRLPFDCRITVNVESKVNVNDGLKVQMERKKDRLSYSLFPFQIDLTQVKNGNESISHELEIEFSEPSEFIQLLLENKSGKRAAEYINSLLNTVRYLNNAALKM